MSEALDRLMCNFAIESRGHTFTLNWWLQGSGYKVALVLLELGLQIQHCFQRESKLVVLALRSAHSSSDGIHAALKKGRKLIIFIRVGTTSGSVRISTSSHDHLQSFNVVHFNPVSA